MQQCRRMVRHYKRKGMKMKWTEEDTEKAIAHAKHHRNVKAAARLFKVSPSTLRYRISEKGGQIGHPAALSPAQEREIVDTCMLFSEWGFGLGRREVDSVLQSYLKYTLQKNPFRDDVPGEGWWSGFIRRHPELSRRRPQQLQLVRAHSSSEEVITHWYTECLGAVLTSLKLADQPGRIYNVESRGSH